MNFLAHAYLSFNQPEILAGNMISDFVKGKKQYTYTSMIQKGIRLHRSIDDFTDNHPATREIKEFFRPVYRLYSGAFTDIVYDYFLANDSAEFADTESLELFTKQTYTFLESNIHALPLEFKKVFPHMRQYDWLFNYRNEEGIMKSFNGLTYRSKYLIESATAFSIFKNNRLEMQRFYYEFFPLLKKHAATTLKDLLSND